MLHSWRNLGRVCRCAHESLATTSNIAINGNNKWGNPDWPHRFRYANDFLCTSNYASGKLMDRPQKRRRKKEVLVNHPAEQVVSADIIEHTTHRDGSIYKTNFGEFSYLALYRITERDETQLEPMMLSEPKDCYPHRECCLVHFSSLMMQIYSLKLAKIPINTCSVQLYGYIAVRDYLDPLLNYVFNRSRDDAIIVQQGSLIEMTGPKRGISMDSHVLMEFDMRIKKGDQEEDDLQLIDGVIPYSELAPGTPVTKRINGDCGAVDITSALVYRAVEATIDIVISKVQSGFSLSLSSFVFIDGLHMGIQLFHGAIDESFGLRRYVLAVKMDTWMHLKFKVGQKGSKNDDLERYCSFKANIHGCACQQIMLDVASVSVKVTWSIMPLSPSVFHKI
ncbi:hypothetical protein ACP70R_009135 [Stipagrostis hirtigluma subsp. patula]